VVNRFRNLWSKAPNAKAAPYRLCYSAANLPSRTATGFESGKRCQRGRCINDSGLEEVLDAAIKHGFAIAHFISQSRDPLLARRRCSSATNGCSAPASHLLNVEPPDKVAFEMLMVSRN
jgi:hypothetical protein